MRPQKHLLTITMFRIRKTLCLFALLFPSLLPAAVEVIPPGETTPGFPLSAAGRAATIVLPTDAPEVVKIAAGDLAKDIESVTGAKPQVVPSGSGAITGPRVVLRMKDIGRWEAFRISSTPEALTIDGNDPRGLAYGIYEVSRRIGVSPWSWWADVPVAKRKQLHLSTGTDPIDQPAVKFRGIFINDEDWGLEPWSSKTYEPEVKGIGPKTYARIFELLLRLRANYLWPAMHPTTTPFHLVPGNPETADRYAIVVGSSHAEPMLRNNGGEWKHPEKQFNFLTHRDKVLSYWEERAEKRTNGESIFTLGMRGIHDSPIMGPKDQKERIETLEEVFAAQRDMLARHFKRDATKIPQMFCPYKEVLDDYNAGLEVPDDVTIVWPDDNYGYIRRFPTPEETKRSGGLGVYYHVSYSGMPQSWLWIDTWPPAVTWSEMTRAYEQGSRTLWVVNCGDIKGCERSTEFFLDLAWHADRTDPEAPARFLRETAARDFGKDHADAIAGILIRLQAINFARKTEHLQWHLSLTPYQPTELNEAEIEGRLDACSALLKACEAVGEQLPADADDAFFQLVGYPVAITAAANERYFRAELARADVTRGRSPDANHAASQAGEKRVDELTARYNNDIAGGKWRNIVSENGYSPKAWPRFQRDTKAKRPAPAEDNVCPPAPPAPVDLPRPDGARPGDFVERDGVISIHAGHFSKRNDLPDGAGWRAVPGLGRTGSAVTVLPSTASITPGAAPSLDYRFHNTSPGPATLSVRLLPTHPLITSQGLRLAVAIDDNPPVPLAVTTGFETKRSNEKFSEWQTRVMTNATDATATIDLKPGWHTLRLVAVEAGVVVDRIVLAFGDLPPSYDGPDETRIPMPGSESPIETGAIDVWPKGKMPGKGARGPEGPFAPERTDAIRTTNVSRPTLTVFPAAAKDAAALVICPGGGYSYVVSDKEGTEIAAWLNSIGITGIVLKYRVPHNRAGALQDLQRSLSLARTKGPAWHVDPQRLGVIGFSAGGHLAAKASAPLEPRSYSAIDDTDLASCRPDFAVLVYPAYLDDGDGHLTPDLNLKADIPPTLIVHSDDDRKFILGSRLYEAALDETKVSYSFLRYPTGGHGYGLRCEREAKTWPQDAAAWLKELGM